MKKTKCCDHEYIGENHTPIRDDGYCMNCGYHPEVKELRNLAYAKTMSGGLTYKAMYIEANEKLKHLEMGLHQLSDMEEDAQDYAANMKETNRKLAKENKELKEKLEECKKVLTLMLVSCDANKYMLAKQALKELEEQ